MSFHQEAPPRAGSYFTKQEREALQRKEQQTEDQNNLFVFGNDNTATFMDLADNSQNYGRQSDQDSVRGHLHIEKGQFKVLDNYIYASSGESDRSMAGSEALDSIKFLSQSFNQPHRGSVTDPKSNKPLIKVTSSNEGEENVVDEAVRESHSLGRLNVFPESWANHVSGGRDHS
jgi:hypothetical protein